VFFYFFFPLSYIYVFLSRLFGSGRVIIRDDAATPRRGLPVTQKGRDHARMPATHRDVPLYTEK